MPAHPKSKRAAKPKAQAKPANRQRGKGYNPNPPPPPKEYQFKPGQSGNPSGKPKGAVILSKAYYAKLAEAVPGDVLGRTYAELVASGQIVSAAKGNTPAAAEIRKATEGDKMTLDVSRLSDDELDAKLAELERVVRAGPGGETTPTDSGGEASPE